MPKPQIALFLMTSKGLAVLDGIIIGFGAGVVSRVVGARDGAVERDYFDEIRELAASHDIPFFERVDAPLPGPQEVCFAVGWRWLIRGAERLIVIHDSILPRYRGFAPLVSCLINGETTIGATALFASDNYDEGDVVAQGAIEVTYPLTVATAIELVSSVYVRLARELVERLIRGEALVGRSQDNSQATYSLWRDEDDYRIDWARSASWIRRFVDAVGHPYKGASAIADARLVRILQVEERVDVQVEHRVPGKVIFVDEGVPSVVCGEGLLKIVQLVDDQTGAALLPIKKFRTRFR
jgi:methionyl-tRNA formyltransferase